MKLLDETKKGHMSNVRQYSILLGISKIVRDRYLYRMNSCYADDFFVEN